MSEARRLRGGVAESEGLRLATVDIVRRAYTQIQASFLLHEVNCHSRLPHRASRDASLARHVPQTVQPSRTRSG